MTPIPPPQSAMEKLARFALAQIEVLPISKRPEIYEAAAACLSEGDLHDAAMIAAAQIREAEKSQLFIAQLLSAPAPKDGDGQKPA